MFRLNDIVELGLYGVVGQGQPNQEYIVLRAWDNGPVQLAQYFLMLGWKNPGGEGAVPLNDNLFWFEEFVLQPSQWLFLYTGPGQKTTFGMPDGQPPVYVLHWNRPTVVFTSDNVVPIILRADGVALGKSPDYVLSGPSRNAQQLAAPRGKG